MCGSVTTCGSVPTIWRNGGERGHGGRGVHEVQPRVQRARCLSIDRQSTGGVLTNETTIALKQPQPPLPWAADGGARPRRR
jgi:hypothetical protein